jgi:hypothetical protein
VLLGPWFDPRLVKFDPVGPIDEFFRSVGRCSLAHLPRHNRAADICLMPTIAQSGAWLARGRPWQTPTPNGRRRAILIAR